MRISSRGWSGGGGRRDDTPSAALPQSAARDALTAVSCVRILSPPRPIPKQLPPTSPCIGFPHLGPRRPNRNTKMDDFAFALFMLRHFNVAHMFKNVSFKSVQIHVLILLVLYGKKHKSRLSIQVTFYHELNRTCQLPSPRFVYNILTGRICFGGRERERGLFAAAKRAGSGNH